MVACEAALAPAPPRAHDGADAAEVSAIVAACAEALPPGPCAEAWRGFGVGDDPRGPIAACAEALCPAFERPLPLVCGLTPAALTDAGAHDGWAELHARALAPSVGVARSRALARAFSARLLAPPPDEDPAAARVNGVPIASSELAAAVRSATLMAPGEEAPDARVVLARLIDRELVQQLMRRERIALTEEEIAREQAAFIEAMPPGFLRWIGAAGRGPIDIRMMVEEKLGIERVLEARGLLAVSGEASRAFYHANPARFRSPEARRAWEVFVPAPRGLGAEVRRAALVRITEAHDELMSGRSFADVARRYSDGRNAHKGGDLDYVSRDVFPDEVAEAAFSMRDGELSRPIASELGFHIVRVGERRAERRMPFDEAAQLAGELARAELFRAERRRLLGELRRDAAIEVFVGASGDVAGDE